MAVSKIKKAHFIIHVKLKEEIISDLQKAGCVQIKDVTSKIENPICLIIKR